MAVRQSMRRQSAEKASMARGNTEEHRIKRSCFTFETTHHALWAEEVAIENGIPAELVPAPPQANARCNLALETLPEDFGRLTEVLERAGVAFAIYRG